MTQFGKLAMVGELKPRLIRQPKAPLSWRLRNMLRWSWIWGLIAEILARWFSKTFGVVTATSSLEARVRQLNKDHRRHYELMLEQGRHEEARSYYEQYAVWHNYGVLSRKSVTNAGVTYMRDDFNAAAGGADITLFKWHRSGSSSTAENVTDVALGAEIPYAALGSQGTNGTNVYQTVATITYYVGQQVQEHGIFSASTSTTLWDRSQFAVINVSANDSISYTYNLTITAGG